MGFFDEGFAGLLGTGMSDMGGFYSKRAQELYSEAEAKRKDQQVAQESIDALNLAKSGLGDMSPLEGMLTQKADRLYARRLSNINRNATSGAEAQVAASGAVDQLGADYTDAAIAGADATQQLRQQNKAAYYGITGDIANQRSQMYQNNVLMPYLQKMALSQSAEQNAVNLKVAGQQQSGNVLGDIVGGLFSLGGLLL